MNKNALIRGSVVVALLLTSVVGFTAELTIRLTDPKWDGQQVPKDQVCQKFKGAGATPAMQVTGVPTGTQALVVAFNDESYGPMDKGGHGVLRFDVAAGNTSFDLPEIPGETDDLPDGVSKVSGHRAPGWSGTGGAYLPPCSGGRGNTNSATVSAVKGEQTLASGKIKLGTF